MKVSIITICYNSAGTIEKSIKSVLEQKNADVEYIIVDGASEDETLDIVNRYKDQIDRIISEKDKGISDAFNKGLEASTGDVIGFINSDDLLLPGVIKLLQNNFDKNIDVLYGDAVIYDVYNKLHYIRKARDIKNMSYELPFVHQSCFIRKSAYDKWGGYSNDYKICMDYDCLATMYINGAVFKYIPEVLSEFMYGGTSYNHPWKTIRENVRVSRLHGFNRWKEYIYASKYCIRVIVKRSLSRLGIWKKVSVFIHHR